MLQEAHGRAEFYRLERIFLSSLADQNHGTEGLYLRPSSPELAFLCTETSYTFLSTDEDGYDE
jgi:hypothetical protein